ncbi:hypothetical protein HF086_013753 [Spodoptera exigua]|uniref:Peptidase A2 domain-containing protein n=1 Tax=Spodoptera exigua TaxID=7107 RepID=A0A922MCG4_SPOEX|nr:hypothetical protein HF086_013753 [Spodoptera exigua]
MNCRICSRRHHTLLHRSKDSASSVQSEDSKQPKAIQHGVEEKEEIVNTTIASHHSAKQSTSLALLATATVSARNEHNHTVVLRALIDQGSQASFISEKATQLLKLSRHTARGSIIGVGSTRTNVDHVVQLRIGSRWNPSFEINIQAYVMSKQLTTKIPSTAVPVTHWPHLEGLNLADPDYHKPGPIDLLLGVKEYAQLVQQQLIKGPPGSPCAQKTNLGWILFGEINTKIRLKQEYASTDLESKKDKIQANLKMDLEEGLTSQFKEFANLRELIQVITYCRRFLNFKRSLENTDKDFTTKELEKSLMKCIELVQQEEFKEDIERLKSNKDLKGESKIKTLNPYLDGDGILRVGGRLRNANLEEQVKHPIILGNKNNLVLLIIADAHARTLHGGVQLMLNYIRSKYWVVRVTSDPPLISLANNKRVP